MISFKRSSGQATATVVLALAEQPATWRYGYELCQQLGLRAGSLYPSLMRLADGGLLETAWEREVPNGHRPRPSPASGPRWASTPTRRPPRPGSTWRSG
jgi:DNA-binding PadR family transcriptional regulator